MEPDYLNIKVEHPTLLKVGYDCLSMAYYKGDDHGKNCTLQMSTHTGAYLGMIGLQKIQGICLY